MSDAPSPAADWPFESPRREAVMTTWPVMRGEVPVLRVYRDEEDGEWEFHGPGPPLVDSICVVALEEVVGLDPSLRELATLEPG